MRRQLRRSLALAFLFSLAAFAQDATRAPQSAATDFSRKAVTLFGTISDDGHSFLADPDAEVWTVTNPDSLKSHGGERVKLQAQVNRRAIVIRVLCVKPQEDRFRTTANLGDSAFRR